MKSADAPVLAASRARGHRGASSVESLEHAGLRRSSGTWPAMIAGPSSPGVGEPVYQPAGKAPGGTSSTPSSFRPRSHDVGHRRRAAGTESVVGSEVVQLVARPGRRRPRRARQSGSRTAGHGVGRRLLTGRSSRWHGADAVAGGASVAGLRRRRSLALTSAAPPNRHRGDTIRHATAAYRPRHGRPSLPCAMTGGRAQTPTAYGSCLLRSRRPRARPARPPRRRETGQA